jgi:purine-binding chemotaxis protein CheW
LELLSFAAEIRLARVVRKSVAGEVAVVMESPGGASGMSATMDVAKASNESGTLSAADAAVVGNLNQIVSFNLADEEYGLDIMKVQEIILIGEITQMPQAPPYVRGLINLRGHVIPIIDLRQRFGLPETGKNESQRIIVVNVSQRTIGIVVDEVDQVLRVKAEDMEPPPTSIKGIKHDFISGLAKLENKLVILLDVENLLTEQEQQGLEDASRNESTAASGRRVR